MHPPTTFTHPDGPGPQPARTAPLAGCTRYTLGAEIARGGMGEVYRATDTALNREVAVKVLQGKFAPDSGTARRFFDEARITAQLQHPNIPAVHDLGTLPDGRPFLAMKLIKGDTLDDLLKARTGPADDRGRFVAAFEQVCQAVAYAHAHSVIHRDLKPANVMVGAFGEVQVMDWGLAKVLASRASDDTGLPDPDATAAGTEIQSMRDSDHQFTQAGSVLGTPAYMPPEQAIGAVDQIDARSDVFGLGGILSAVLTGLPPFVGPTGESTRQLAAKGKLGDCFARLDECGGDPELVALAKRCLAPERDDRPADAGAVAKAVAALRTAADERARQAEVERERLTVRAAEGRKRRRVWVGAGVAVGVLLATVAAVSTVAVVRISDQRDIIAAREAEVTRERDEVAAQKKLADDRLAVNRRAIFAFVNDAPNVLEGSPYPQSSRELNQICEKILAEVDSGGADEGNAERGRLALLYRRALIAQAEGRWGEEVRLLKEAMAEARRQDNAGNPRRDTAATNVGAMALELAKSLIRAGEPDVSTDPATALRKACLAIAHLGEAAACYERILRSPQTGEKTQDELESSLGNVALSLGEAHNLVSLATSDATAKSAALADATRHTAEAVRLDTAALHSAEQAKRPVRQIMKLKTDLALAQGAYARLLKSHDRAAAASAYEQAVAPLIEVHKAHPGVFNNTIRLQTVASDYGDFALMELNDSKKAEQMYLIAATTLNPIALPPGIEKLRSTLSTDLYKLAATNRRNGNTADAARRFALCVELREAVVRTQSRVAERLKQPLHVEYVNAKINLMLAEARAGMHPRATDTAAWVSKSFPSDPWKLVLAACGYALSTEGLKADDPLRAKYVAEAFRLLSVAVEAGYKDREFLARDPDLDPIRSDLRFVPLLAVIDENGGKKPARP